MAKIIKVGSQNPTFTSQKAKKASPIHTHRNSNEATNPFKFTNFEGKTLPFEYADVFEGFRPQAASKLRMIASSVAGSMNKMKSAMPESIVNFVRKVRSGITSAWSHASGAWAYAKNTNILDVPGISHTKEGLNIAKDFLLAERHLPEALTSRLTGMKEGVTSRVEALSHRATNIGNDMAAAWNGMISRVAFAGKQKYANMSVAELETHLAAALAEGGINE